jgi:hypothetical protein
MQVAQFARAANFPAIWLERALLTGAFFEMQAREFEVEYGQVQPEGGTEHWRYGSFMHWLRSNPGKDLLHSLVEAALQDPDPGMAGNVLLAVVSLPACSQESFALALASVNRHRDFHMSQAKLQSALTASHSGTHEA